MTHPSESGHWYDRQGNPVYEVPSADGKKMVKPDIRHAKKLGLYPGTTTIIREAAKPGLERWKTQQAILSALTLPRLDGESLDSFAERALRDSGEQAKKAAERGTAIHGSIQGHYEGQGCPDEYRVFVASTVRAIHEKYGDMGWTPEVSFSHPLGFGGKADLYTKWELSVVLDIKSKEFSEEQLADKKFRLAWDEHAIQLAAYREGLELPKAVCANVFVSVNNPGLVHIHEWPEEELKRGWRMFQALLDYWYARTGVER